MNCKKDLYILYGKCWPNSISEGVMGYYDSLDLAIAATKNNNVYGIELTTIRKRISEKDVLVYDVAKSEKIG